VRARRNKGPLRLCLFRRTVERNLIVVSHFNVEGGTIKVRRPCRTADGTVVFLAAIGRTDDQRLARPVSERLQLVERGPVDQQLAGAPAGEKLGQRQALSGTLRQWRWKVAVMVSSKTSFRPIAGARRVRRSGRSTGPSHLPFRQTTAHPAKRVGAVGSMNEMGAATG